MRDIKFRAWHKDFKKMYGVAVLNLNNSGYQASIGLSTGGKVALDRVELMQYTGLKDKNGKEIYEGDIVRAVSPHPDIIWSELAREQAKAEEVVYEPENAAFGFKNSGLGFNNNLKVIGNIYENKELLK